MHFLQEVKSSISFIIQDCINGCFERHYINNHVSDVSVWSSESVSCVEPYCGPGGSDLLLSAAALRAVLRRTAKHGWLRELPTGVQQGGLPGTLLASHQPAAVLPASAALPLPHGHGHQQQHQRRHVQKHLLSAVTHHGCLQIPLSAGPVHVPAPGSGGLHLPQGAVRLRPKPNTRKAGHHGDDANAVIGPGLKLWCAACTAVVVSALEVKRQSSSSLCLLVFFSFWPSLVEFCFTWNYFQLIV